ncbi:hypothetical protein QCA50_019403 [Cerrena zonata]|uniref:SnoaL-like domain-containing protein n=1 Tax=Cerrena zonata TaxID=2478898 RepID=A0AAW0FK28_9APHY
MVLAESSEIPSSPSPQLRLALKWMESMTDGNIEGLASTLSDDYVHQIYPASTGIEIQRGKEAYLTNVRQVMSMFTENVATVLEIIESPGIVILHERSDGKTKLGVDYKNEAMMTYYVEEVGNELKIVKVKAFVDSKFTAGFAAEMRKAVEALK